MTKEPDYSKMTFGELLAAFPGWPQGFEPERNHTEGSREVDFGDEPTPPSAPSPAGDPEEGTAAPSPQPGRAHDRGPDR